MLFCVVLNLTRNRYLNAGMLPHYVTKYCFDGRLVLYLDCAIQTAIIAVLFLYYELIVFI